MKKLTLLLVVVSFFLINSCTKERFSEKSISQSNILNAAKSRFLELPANAGKNLRTIAKALAIQDEKTQLLSSLAKENIFPKWNFPEIRTKSNNSSSTTVRLNGVKINSDPTITIPDTTILIPLVKDSTNKIAGFLACGLGDTVVLKVYDSKNYKNYSYTPNGNLPTANSIAKEIIRMEFNVFNHDKFSIADSNLNLFKKSTNSSQRISYRLKHGKTHGSTGVRVNVEGEQCMEEAWFYRNEETGEVIQVTDWYPVGPFCDGTNVFYIYSVSSADPGISNTSGLNAGGGGYGGADSPPDSWEATDENGYYLSRMAYVDNLLLNEPFNIIPCDKLNLMPLDDASAYGLMFKRVAQREVPSSIITRLNTIAGIAPTSVFSSFKVQTISNAVGPVVNCDYFPIHITSLPTNVSADALLEFFRKYTNSFINASLGVSFAPYTDGSYTDAPKFYSNYEDVMGALVHLDLINDGTVVLSDYYRSTTPYKSRFTYSTITSPLDYNHPVSGNREFGIFANPNNNGYTFYTMGVDRTTDWMFAAGNITSMGFNAADELWQSVQAGMVQYINNNGGQASIQTPVIARPRWNHVERYLRGDITFTL